jgi:hypothetical protein
MTVFIRSEFTPDTLLTFNGYHLQIFAAGRAKISLRTLVNNKKHEFFAARPKKDRAAYQRQKARSLTTLPDHYAAVDQLLSAHPDAKVFRVHAKGDNNATADNAHVVASLDQEALWLVMSGVVHRWELTTLLVHVLLEGKGKRTGEASIFYEYVPTQDHDWQDAEFVMADYKVGQRVGGGKPREVPQPEQPPRPTPKPLRPVPKRESRATIDPRTETASDYVLDDPEDDGALFTDPPHDPPYEPFPDQAEDTAVDTKAFKGGIAYGKTGLWAAYKDSSKQTEQLPTP